MSETKIRPMDPAARAALMAALASAPKLNLPKASLDQPGTVIVLKRYSFDLRRVRKVMGGPSIKDLQPISLVVLGTTESEVVLAPIVPVYWREQGIDMWTMTDGSSDQGEPTVWKRLPPESDEEEVSMRGILGLTGVTRRELVLMKVLRWCVLIVDRSAVDQALEAECFTMLSKAAPIRDNEDVDFDELREQNVVSADVQRERELVRACLSGLVSEGVNGTIFCARR